MIIDYFKKSWTLILFINFTLFVFLSFCPSFFNTQDVLEIKSESMQHHCNTFCFIWNILLLVCFRINAFKIK